MPLRLFSLLSSFLIFFLFLPDFTRNLLLEHKIAAVVLGVGAASCAALLRFRDRNDPGRGDQGAGRFMRLFRLTLTHDKRASAVSAFMFALFAALVTLFAKA